MAAIVSGAQTRSADLQAPAGGQLGPGICYIHSYTLLKNLDTHCFEFLEWKKCPSWAKPVPNAFLVNFYV